MAAANSPINKAYATMAIQTLRALSRPFRRRAARFLWPQLDHELVLDQECSLLGRASSALTGARREIVRSILDACGRLWRAGETPIPPGTDVYASSSRMPPASVAVVMPRYINCDPAYIDHDISYHVARSAEAAGARVSQFFVDDITYRGTGDRALGLERLAQFLSQTRPQVVAFDANFIPNSRTIDAETILALRKSLDFKFVALVPDCYDACPFDFLGYWHRVADLSIIFHRNTKYLRALPDQSKVLVCPALPFHEPTFVPGDVRDIDLSYSGSDTRQRRMFVDAAAQAGLRTECIIHDRTREKAPTIEGFARLLGRSKLVFNNGWLNHQDSIITGRVAETILSGAVLIQEIGAPLDDYLVPFVHYIPVANLAQFVAYCKVLVEDNERRDAIAQTAREFWLEHYASRRFWQRVAQACQLS